MIKKKLFVFLILLVFKTFSASRCEDCPRSDNLKDKVTLKEHHFYIVVPCFRNEKYCIKNIESVAAQDYKHWIMRIIIDGNADDRDKTFELLTAYIREHNLQGNVIITCNNKRLLALHNIYNAIYECSHDDWIVVLLDGDDKLHDNSVLQKLNSVYQNKNVWVTYGQFEEYPSHRRGWCCPMPEEIIQNNAFRQFTHLPSHLRTFYVKLFKLIKKEDLMYQGQFYPMTWDQAIMFPLMEMAGERHQFISDILLDYNTENDLNDHKVDESLQRNLAQIIRAQKPYTRLTYNLFTNSEPV